MQKDRQVTRTIPYGPIIYGKVVVLILLQVYQYRQVPVDDVHSRITTDGSAVGHQHYYEELLHLSRTAEESCSEHYRQCIYSKA